MRKLEQSDHYKLSTLKLLVFVKIFWFNGFQDISHSLPPFLLCADSALRLDIKACRGRNKRERPHRRWGQLHQGSYSWSPESGFKAYEASPDHTTNSTLNWRHLGCVCWLCAQYDWNWRNRSRTTSGRQVAHSERNRQLSDLHLCDMERTQLIVTILITNIAYPYWRGSAEIIFWMIICF